MAKKYHASWQKGTLQEESRITIGDDSLMLIKPQTFMNSSGNVLPSLLKKGIKHNEILVVHDELEKPFGSVAIKEGGSARGHNGLKSIIEKIGPDFFRVRIGIGRPEQREHVPDYVLEPFNEPSEKVDAILEKAVNELEKFILTDI